MMNLSTSESMIRGRKKEPHAPLKERMAAAPTPGKARGKTTWVSAWKRLAPSKKAASSSFRGTVSMKPFITQSIKGIAPGGHAQGHTGQAVDQVQFPHDQIEGQHSRRAGDDLDKRMSNINARLKRKRRGRAAPLCLRF